MRGQERGASAGELLSGVVEGGACCCQLYSSYGGFTLLVGPLPSQGGEGEARSAVDIQAGRGDRPEWAQ